MLVLRLSIICISFFIPFKIFAYDQVTSCADISTSYQCAEITACQELTLANQYYLLMNDVISPTTCFPIRAGSFIFDLNGHTINYAQSDTGHAFHDEWANKDDITIKNGKMISGKMRESHAIYFQTDGSHNLLISDLDIFARGVQTNGIWIETGNNLDIHNVNITLDSEREKKCNHYGSSIIGIGFRHRGGKINIYNNKILGRGMKGISISDCGSWSSSEPMEIHDNYIRMDSEVVDGYAITLESLHNLCSDGTKIYNNLINQINGRGILVAGWNTSTDQGPGNVEIVNNSVYVKEAWDCESNVPGHSYALRLRFGAHDINVHHNYFLGLAGSGLGFNSDPSKDKTTAIGMFVTSSQPYGNNLVIENNMVDASTNDTDLKATALWLGSEESDNESLNPVKLGNNRFKSNDTSVWASAAGTGAYRANFDGDIIIKGDNPLDYRSLEFGYWYFGEQDLNLKNLSGENGGDVHDTHFYLYSDSDGTAQFSNINILWTLKITVLDQNGVPLQNADVVIKDKNDDQKAHGTTDINGFYSTDLVESTFAGINPVGSTGYSPYSVTVNYNGDILTRAVDLDGPKQETFKFDSQISPTSDLTAPLVSDGTPYGTLSSDTSSVNLSVVTNEDATCGYSLDPGVSFADKPFSFSSTGGTTHTSAIDNLSSGGTNNFYVRCIDGSGNANADDYLVSFWISYEPIVYESPFLSTLGIIVTGGCNLEGFRDSKNFFLLLIVPAILVFIVIRRKFSVGNLF